MITAAEMAALHAVAFAGDRPWNEQEFSSLMATPGTFATGDARAFALVRIAADEAELLTIATHPGHRRRGLARTLMQAWQAEAVGRGARRAILEVARDNLAARALYTACGYAEIAHRPGYYATPDGLRVDAVLMDRSLA